MNAGLKNKAQNYDISQLFLGFSITLSLKPYIYISIFKTYQLDGGHTLSPT